MEIYIVCGFRRLQSKHSTSQCNCAETNLLWTSSKTLDRNSNFQVDFQSIYIDYIDFYHQINSIYKCVYSWLNLMSCIDLYLMEKVYPAKLFSIHYVNTSGLKLNFEKGISIQCFRRRPQQVSLRPLHCDVEYFDCVRWKSQTM